MFKWLKNIFVAEVPAPEALQPAPKVEAEVKAEPKPKAAPKAKAEAVALDPWSEAALLKLTKAQLEDKGRQLGVELDRRKKKEDLVKQIVTAKK